VAKLAARAKRTKEMNHALIESKPGELGVGCKCGKRFPTRKTAEGHVADQNLIEANEAKAQAAAAELEHQAKEPVDPEPPTAAVTAAAPEPPTEKKPGDSESKPELPATQPAPATEAPQAVGPSNMPLDLENLSLNQINFIGQTMAKSGMFPDVTDGAKALVKILAGKEIGVTPFQSMTNIHVIQGRPRWAPTLMAAKVKGSGKYDYRVMDLTNETCSILSGSATPSLRAAGLTWASSRTAWRTPSAPDW
jgi:hypothetical protein